VDNADRECVADANAFALLAHMMPVGSLFACSEESTEPLVIDGRMFLETRYASRKYVLTMNSNLWLEDQLCTKAVVSLQTSLLCRMIFCRLLQQVHIGSE
jgi:hypothetical protein